MSDVTLESYETNGRWRFDLVLPALFRPRRAFARIAPAGTALWHTPIVILLATGLIRTLVAGAVRQAATLAAGPGAPPPGFEFYTPEQQAQLQQAMAATSGPVFVYLLPAVVTLLGVYLGWLVLGGILHLGLTLVGGRGRSQQALNVVAWSLLPFALRDAVRIVAMWASGQPLAGLGLSGFAPTEPGNLTIYLTALLALVDLYLLWHMVLLLAGVRAADNLSRFKAWGVVLIVVVGLLLLRALPALIAAQFSGLTVIRPFI
ncbi:MAG: YIP1 family protein [Chloroflexi bacterium]|nr:YIP1 family protein [Chloroflexota bacterium]MCI0577633.1 YIP1 family protein [Chloroflexota bacterium]MCI0647586.1 YIP1 family protein [Chloroflexota bacterium]MCI0732169.1 YIP1 family protein [Chloroflexota bacterium]